LTAIKCQTNNSVLERGQ